MRINSSRLERKFFPIKAGLFGDNYPLRFVLPHLIIKPVGEITHLIKSSFNFSVFISCFKPALVRKLMLGIRLDDQKPYFNLKYPLLPTQ